MDGNIEEQEEQEFHEATIGLKEGGDAFAAQCIDVCDDVDGEAQVEAVLGLVWNIMGMHPFWNWAVSHQPADMDDDIGDHLGFALRVGIAIGRRLGSRTDGRN